jgi:TRAP-type mannitol/chloroaromatic compound transport system substrate-binding protein
LRRSSRLAAAALVLAAAFAADADAAGERVRLKMHSAFPSRAPLVGELARRAAEEIGRASGGGLLLRFHEPEALVPRFGYADAVASGALEAAFGTPAVLGGRAPALALFTATPFGLTPAGHAAWLSEGGGRALYDELLGRFGLAGVPCGMLGPDGAGWFRRPIERPEDLRGLRIRMFGLGARVIDKLGASAQLLAAPDLVPALAAGALDGAEFGPPYSDLQHGLHQAAAHYYYPAWHQPAALFDLVFPRALWAERLDARQREAAEAACAGNLAHGIAEDARRAPPALAELARKGSRIAALPAPVWQALAEAWTQVSAEEAARDPDFARVRASYEAFRARWRPG